MDKELTSFQYHQVCDIVPIYSNPSTLKPTGLRWVCKTNSDNSFKIRLIVQGWGQRTAMGCGGMVPLDRRIGSQSLFLEIDKEENWGTLQFDI